MLSLHSIFANTQAIHISHTYNRNISESCSKQALSSISVKLSSLSDYSTPAYVSINRSLIYDL